MGTHPIFESDFDCLTECRESLVKGSKLRQKKSGKLFRNFRRTHGTVLSVPIRIQFMSINARFAMRPVVLQLENRESLNRSSKSSSKQSYWFATGRAPARY